MQLPKMMEALEGKGMGSFVIGGEKYMTIGCDPNNTLRGKKGELTGTMPVICMLAAHLRPAPVGWCSAPRESGVVVIPCANCTCAVCAHRAERGDNKEDGERVGGGLLRRGRAARRRQHSRGEPGRLPCRPGHLSWSLRSLYWHSALHSSPQRLSNRPPWVRQGLASLGGAPISEASSGRVLHACTVDVRPVQQ